MKAHRGYIALLPAVAVVALGACGGDDDSASKVSASDRAGAEQGTTGTQTGASGATGTKRARPKRTAKAKQPPEAKSGTEKGNKTGSPASAPPTSEKEPPKPQRLTPEQLKQLEPNYHAQARELCKASTLAQLAQFYGIDSGDPQKVAEAFAADYLAGVRDAVTRGCKEGLLESK